MKVILIVLVVVAGSWADDCDNTFGAYLNALKDGMTADDSTASQLENEFTNNYRDLIHKCFANGGCQLTDDELDSDIYGDDGPMKGCERCQGLARKLDDMFMKSQENVRKCLREHLGQAVREELEPCIQGKISNGYNFHVPPVPDFDALTFKNIDTVKKGLYYRIWARSRMDACNNVNPGKYSVTGPCMDNGYSGIYSKHCQLAKDAKAKAVSSSCSARFSEVKKATCQCMDDKRQDWHNRFDKIKNIVDNAQSASQCGKDISDVVGAWLNKLQTAMSECLPNDGNGNKPRDLRTLIELGCGQVINGGVKKNELTVGFRFIRFFLDAVNDRIQVFCDKNCSY